MTTSLNIKHRSTFILRGFLSLVVLVCALGMTSRAEAGCFGAPNPFYAPSGFIGYDRPIFSWAPISAANYGYTLYVIQDGGPNDGIVSRTIGIQGTAFQPNDPLPHNVWLRSKVKGEGTCGAGDYADGPYFYIYDPSEN